MLDTLRSWWQDRLLRGVIRNSSYLFSSNTISAGLSALQGIFVARLLGAGGYGLVSGTIIVFASNINRFLSFRMSEVVVKYLGQYLAENRRDRAGAFIKGIAIIEALTSVVAYLVLVLVAPIAARYLAKDEKTVQLFIFYGLALLATLIYETSTGILQATNRFNRLALVNLIQSVVTASLIFLAFITKRGIMEVLAAYLIGKACAGLTIVVFAFGELNQSLGSGWWRSPLRLIPDWREPIWFAFNTNFNGTVNLFVRDSETLLIGLFRSQTEVGYYRLAQGVINMVMLPIDPFIGPTYAEITRTIAARQWALTKRLLKRVSGISAIWTLSVGGILAIFGWWIIPFVYGAQFAPAYPALVILLIGYGFANIFQWNRPLLLALGMPNYPLVVAILVGLVKTGLTVGLTPILGYQGEAFVLTSYFLASIGINIRRGIMEIDYKTTAEEKP